MNLCICSFNVPTTYNDGRVVKPELIDAIEQALVRQFEGYTDRGRMRGNWRGQDEVHTWYSVYCEPHRINVLRQIINEVGLKLGQIQMALEISPASAELIDVEPESPPNAEPAAKQDGKHNRKKGRKVSEPMVLWPEDET